jgi:hypothetical protein
MSEEDTTLVDFVGYEPEEVLRALHDCAKTYNNSTFYHKLGSLDLVYARDLLATRDKIDYLNGRFICVSFETFPLIDSEKYDQKNGEGMMLMALDMLAKRAEREKN